MQIKEQPTGLTYMNTTFRSIHAWSLCGYALTRSQLAAISPRHAQYGFVEIGKLNILLIALIAVILFSLLSRQESSESTIAEMRVQTQQVAPAALGEVEHVAQAPAELEPEPAPVIADAPTDTPVKPAVIKRKKNFSFTPAAGEAAKTEPVTVTEQLAATDQSSHGSHAQPLQDTIVFNIWSVSELRLRAAYAAYLNDNSISRPQVTEGRKKEYLTFVNGRSKKCGELDNKFASNINTVEKLTFNPHELGTLECHTSHNVSEIERLHQLGILDS